MPYLTPDTLPSGTYCRTVLIPAHIDWLIIVNGALSELLKAENFEQFGSITPEEVADRFETMFFEFRDSECEVAVPVGSIVMWTEVIPPSRWLLCDGGAVAIADYPELYALWGDKYGGTETQFGLPDMEDYSPMGAGGNVDLDGTAGAINHTLTTDEMPSHTHSVTDPGHIHAISLRGSGTAGGANNRANAPTQTTLSSNLATDSATTGITATNSEGQSNPHNNLSPVFGVNFIVYGGKAP